MLGPLGSAFRAPKAASVKRGYRYRGEKNYLHPLKKYSTPHQSTFPTMPKSKRAKVVHLTKVEKKGKELTLKVFANVRECLDQYLHCFVFSVDNMRNTYLKDVRNELSDSRYVTRPVPASYKANFDLELADSSLARQK